ncbi:MAG: TIR domain-containing protein [Lachnospiraceae bacterium]|nr:TIR domain-containing protein [Lachnospiraceae bacterium]
MSRYIAFISYRHKNEDTETARLLRKGIENAHLPKAVKSGVRRRVFRDTDELPTSSDLSKDIENALNDSDHLIALCSEEYVKSKWCLKEIDMYIYSGRKDRILPVLLSGTPETSIPECIRDIPPVSDLRDDLDKGTSLGRAVYHDLPGILSKMLGIPEEDIRRAEHRFRISAALAVFAVIFFILTGFGLYAIHTANRISELNTQISEATVQARQAQALALEERNTALIKRAQFLAKQGWVAIDEGRFDDAIRLGLEALPEDLNGDEPVSDEALAVLRTALAMNIRLPYVKTAEYDLPVNIYKVWDTLKDWAVIETDDGEFYYLSYGDGSLEPYEGVYNWKSVYDYRNELLGEAEKEGYTGFRYRAVGVPEYYCFYGNGLPMKCISRYPEGEFFYTVNGELFYATGAESLNTIMVAWCEYEGDEKPCAALFDMGTSEALSVLPVHNVVSVAFGDSGDCKQIYVTDDTGTIYAFGRDNNELVSYSEGGYTKISFVYRNAPRILALTDDGKAQLLDAFTLKPIYEIDPQADITDIYQNSKRNFLLALCEDGVNLYSIDSGDHLMNVVTDDRIIHTCGEGVVRNTASFSGDKILVFYSDRLEVYQPGRDDEKTGENTFPLCDEAVITAQTLPFYSDDGKAIYLVDAGTISKWDAETGELLWVNAPEMPFIGNMAPIILTSDGKSIWRCLWTRDGFEKIDTDSGEAVYSQTFTGEFSFGTAPVDDPYMNRSLFITTQYNSGSSGRKILMINSGTGEPLWDIDMEGMITEGDGSPVFSTDGKELYCVRVYADQSVEEYRSIYEVCAFDSTSGELLRTHTIESVEEMMMVPEKDLAVALRKTEEMSGSSSYEIVNIELSDFTESASVVFPYSGEPVFGRSYLGEITLSWIDAIDEQSTVGMVCVYNSDGSFGKQVVADSFEGRTLLLESGKVFNMFGYDAYYTDDSIRRLEDGIMLLGSTREALNGLSGNGMSFVAAPDGSSICIYKSGMTDEVTPFLIRSYTDEELIETARARLEIIGG